MEGVHILLVEDDKQLRESLKLYLEDEGYSLTAVETCEEALELLKKEHYKVLLTDLNLPGMSGIDMLKKMKEEGVTVPAIMLTAFHSVESAVEAMKLGAQDYLKKPINPVELQILIEKVLERFYLQKEVNYLQKRLGLKLPREEFIGKSPAISRVLDMVEKVSANNQATVLLTGESGTGKNLVAQLIHSNSPRRDRPFVQVTCSAFPENLLESELMGHIKGAFTDASTDKTGLFEYADTGTLFLDEVGDMNLYLQAKVLRVIEEKTFRKVGGLKDIRVDVRILAATNKDLERMVIDGEFREDLFYRLNVIPIRIPPLRERREDVSLLVDFFCKKFSTEIRKDVVGVHPTAMQMLKEYYWPGNLRELRNVVERAILLSNDEIIGPGDLPAMIRRDAPAKAGVLSEQFDLPPQGLSLGELEKNLIIQALRRSGGNLAKAARYLSIPRDKIRYRIQKYNIDIEEVLS